MASPLVLSPSLPSSLSSSFPSSIPSPLPSSFPPSERPNKHWGIQFGGLIALKYLLPIHLETFMKNYENEFFYILKECLRNSNDDIAGAAADLVKSLYLGIKKEFQIMVKNDVPRPVFLSNLIGVYSTHLSCIVEDMILSVLSLDALSCRMLSLCVGFSSSCSILEIMSTQYQRDLLHLTLDKNADVYSSDDCIKECLRNSDHSIHNNSSSNDMNNITVLQNNRKKNSERNILYSSYENENENKNENKKEIENENEIDVLNQSSYTEKVLGIAVSLADALSLLLFRLMLYSRDSQDRYLTALKPGTM